MIKKRKQKLMQIKKLSRKNREKSRKNNYFFPNKQKHFSFFHFCTVVKITQVLKSHKNKNCKIAITQKTPTKIQKKYYSFFLVNILYKYSFHINQKMCYSKRRRKKKKKEEGKKTKGKSEDI